MCEPKNCESDTSVDTKSSWSIIDSSLKESKDLPDETVKNETESDIDFTENSCSSSHCSLTELRTQDSPNAQNTSEDSKACDGFLTFDEFYQTFDSDEDRSKSKKQRKKKKAKSRLSKTDTISILSLAASVLTITGLTLLMMMFPSSVSKTEYEQVQDNYVNIMTSQESNLDEVIKNITRSSEVLEIAHNSNMLSNMTDIIKNGSGPNGELLNEDLLSNITTEFNDKINQSDKKRKTFMDAIRSVRNNTSPLYKSIFKGFGVTTGHAIKSLEELFVDTNFQRIVCTLLQDVCLIKLIYELNKKLATDSTNQVDSTRTNSNIRKSKSKRKVTPTTDSKKLANTPDKFNNKLNEAENKIKELHSQIQHIGSVHRKNIQNVKEKYKAKLNDIKKETDLKSKNKLIQRTHDKYLQKLKLHREDYLKQLEEVKEERRIIMREICNAKCQKDKGQKDECVGNYGVLIPGCYDFQERLKEMKKNVNQTYLPTTNVSLSKIRPSIEQIRNKSMVNIISKNFNENHKVNNEIKESVKNDETPRTTCSLDDIILTNTSNTLLPLKENVVLDSYKDTTADYKFTIKNRLKHKNLQPLVFDEPVQIHKKDLEKWKNRLDTIMAMD